MKINIDLPPWIKTQLTEGETVLFLGSGASLGAAHPENEDMPDGRRLRDLICDKFLGGDEKSTPLHMVAAFARDAAGPRFDRYLADLFKPYEPADFHKLIPAFRWKAIFTTNFDLVIEKAYDQNPDRLQNIKPIVSDYDDHLEEASKKRSVLYYKLHGCASQAQDSSLPLIIAPEQYASYKKNVKPYSIR